MFSRITVKKHSFTPLWEQIACSFPINPVFTNTTMKSTLFGLSLLMGLGVLLAPHSAIAQTVQINLGYLPGLPNQYEENGVWWNKLSTWGTTSPSSLYTVDNDLAGMTWATQVAFTGHSSAAFGSSVYEYPQSVTDSSFYLLGSATAQVVIAGLQSDREYDLIFYGNIRAVAAQRGMTISVQGEGESFSGDLLLTGTSSSSDETEVIFNNIRPDVGGILTLTFSVAEGYDRGVINALTIHSIPEPALGVFGFAGGLLVWVIRKRMKHSLQVNAQ